MRIGASTGGGDCPGLNAVIRAIVRKGVSNYGHEFVGYRDGWRGPLGGDRRPLGAPEGGGILPRGGTTLGHSRPSLLAEDGGQGRTAEHLAAAGGGGLIGVGGEDPLGAASRLHKQASIPVIGVPKTIDNDLSATDYTFGFDTAVNIAMEAIDRLHTTADSHHRVLIVEVMGRHAGWIAFHAGLAGGANVILIPERQFDVEEVCELVGRRLEARFAPIVVVSEGAQPKAGTPEAQDKGLDAFGHVRLGGIAHWLEHEIEQRTGKETRATVLGHVQRGGTPTAFDRVLATRFGLHAIDAVDNGSWGTMTALRGTDIQLAQLSEATAELKTVPKELYEEAEVFFG